MSVDDTHVAINPDVEISSAFDKGTATDAKVRDEGLNGQALPPIDQLLLHNIRYEA